jgi:hypothetical protein
MKEVIETFQKPDEQNLRLFTSEEPYAFRGEVFVERYRISIELIKEPKEIYVERLEELWRHTGKSKTDEWGPIQARAKELGVTMKMDELGEALRPKERVLPNLPKTKLRPVEIGIKDK